MFTGIIEAVGRVEDVEVRADGRRMVISAPGLAAELAEGESISVAGACQTVVEPGDERFMVVTIGTTIARTTLGELAPGSRVNLERALALGDRLSGHLVQGHVDAVGTVRSCDRSGDPVLLDVEVPAIVADTTVLHGSIAIDGVSLTVNALPGPGLVQVALIPYTLEHTTLDSLVPGSRVNLEADMIGKYVHQLANR